MTPSPVREMRREQTALTDLLVILVLAVVAMAALSLAYHLQGYANGAEGEPISYLMFFTLGAGLVAGVGALAFFLRKRRNSNIAKSTIVEEHERPS